MDNVSTEDRLRDYLKRVTAELSQTRQRLRDVEESGREPIAIVGMACRYPGAESPEELWDLVVEGRDAVSEFPRDRGWDLDAIYDPTGERPGTTYVRQAGFLTGATDFDAAFFGVSDREALVMDPQQRVTLETAWQAFEHARIDPTGLRGANCGVFLGAVTGEYGPRYDQAAEDLKDHLMIGNNSSIVSGRISYGLGLIGPAYTIDTGSSSSMVALHSAVRSLRAGDCELALSGGVAVMATPSLFIENSRGKGLSLTGRGRPFDEAADGSNYAEGVGILVLERLSDARRKNHRVLAVIRGTGINHNGTTNGLTTTNTPAAERLFHRALADARLGGDEVDLVEAHTSGSPLSAPIEVQALQNAYGRDRSAENPLYLGTIKGSFGHSAAAAGVGGVIKMVLALRHRIMPKTIVDTPTSLVDWSAGTVRLVIDNRPWPAPGRPRRAAVTSFGYNGTNGHVIVEEAPGEDTTTDFTVTEPRGLTAPATPWVVSAKSGAALRGQAGKLLSHMSSHADLVPRDVGYSLAATRAGHDERAVVIAADTAGFTRGLRALADGEPAAELVLGSVSEAGLAFLSTGRSGVYTGLGRQLYRHSPVFAAAVDEVVSRLDSHLDRSLSDVAFADAAGPVDEEPYAAAASFAVEIGLFRMLEAWGLKPEFTVGRCTGRVAAAHTAGAMTLEDACALLFKTEQRPHDPEVSVFSCVNGDEVSIARLSDTGIDTYMVLGGDAGTSAAARGLGIAESARLIPVLRPDTCEATSVVEALARAHVVGCRVDWNAYFSGSKARLVDLPTYAFQRRRYWLAPGTTSLEQAVPQ